MTNFNLKKLAKGLMTVALLSTVLIACGNKKDDNTAQLNAFTQSCVNCEGITGFPFFITQTKASLFSSYSYGYNQQAAMTINWSFSGQNLAAQPQQQGSQPSYQYGSPAMNYVGKVSAAGQVTVTQIIGGGNGYFCPAIPAGTYTLATYTVGQWTNGVISGLKLVVTGPVSMTISLSQAQAWQNTSQYSQYSNSSYIYGTMVVEQVNGYYCQGLQLNMN